MRLIKLEIELELNRDEFDKFVPISNETVVKNYWSYKPLNVTAVTAKICDDGDVMYGVSASVNLVEHAGQEVRFVNAEPDTLANMAESLAKVLSL